MLDFANLLVNSLVSCSLLFFSSMLFRPLVVAMELSLRGWPLPQISHTFLFSFPSKIFIWPITLRDFYKIARNL